jgi:D-alanyl-lipoteichoic acid acyltransferase DltB (MBOAT superfamily)
MGISFYTFQTMSYSIDVYNQKLKAEKHIGYFSLYVFFFPQLVAGPIERAKHLLGQFKTKKVFNYDIAISGLKLIFWGLFKKIVIADRLAIMVNNVYNSPSDFEGFKLTLATIFFAFQIYCDFSGYTDIAIGTSRMLGIDLMKNFNRPYHASSIPNFWKRWHISLSTWFRDYLYIPIGGNKVIKWRWYYNLFITFVVSGFWHGAQWTFIIWGALHGVYLIIYYLLDLTNSKYKVLNIKFINILITFSLTCFAWIFFRANNLDDAVYIASNLHSGWLKSIELIITNENLMRENILYLGSNRTTFLLSVLFIGFMEVIHFIQRKHNISLIIKNKNFMIRWLIYLTGISILVFFGIYKETEFIYFQF